MSDSTLYESCLRRVLMNLRNRIYIPTTTNPKNPFKRVAPKLVNAIMSAALNYQRDNGYRADDLQPLLICEQLQELKIDDINAPSFNSKVEIIIQILVHLQSGCEKLKILHLPVLYLYESGSISAIRNALGVILEQTSNLEDLNCSFNFDLKALINCRKLRTLRLHFIPQQHWYDFLKKVENRFQTHKCLELFNICHRHFALENVPYGDIAIILRHCPELTSLGFIESSGLLSHLHGKLPSDLKLRHCFWIDLEAPNNVSHRVGEAVKNYPLIEDLDLVDCRSRSVPCLQSLRNLVYLNISLDASVSSDAFNSVLEVIGSHLKHLSLKAANPMDISLLLKNCLNLESLKIFECGFAEFSINSVSLPNLQRLTLVTEMGRLILRLLSGCDQLTELFFFKFISFDDHALHEFLQRNSLSNLELAELFLTLMTESGFRELLQRAPRLEKVNIRSFRFNEDDLRRIISETNSRVQICNDVSSFSKCEFFYKTKKLYEC